MPPSCVLSQGSQIPGILDPPLSKKEISFLVRLQKSNYNIPSISMVVIKLGLFLTFLYALAYTNSYRSRISRRSSSVAARYASQLNGATSNKNDENERKQPNFWSGLAQLITMGAGAPSLGEFKEIDDRGRAIFELEANNFVDSEGNVIQTRAKFFENGYVTGSEDDIKAPGFFKNLLSGGAAIREWEEAREKK